MNFHSSDITANPFAVKTPENLSASELVELFVPYPEFNNLQVSGHQFLNGHRGSGKSMMLKMMCPDSQILYRGRSFAELPYFGVYLSVKATELNAPEYNRLESEPGGSILSEHVLTTKFLSAFFVSIKSHCLPELLVRDKMKAQSSLLKVFLDCFKYAGWESNSQNTPIEFDSLSDALNFVIETIDAVQFATTQYIKRRSFSNATTPYQGVLLGFQDILLPIVKSFLADDLIPSSVYFLLDDADNLTDQQKQILNTWVSYRATDIISLKISTQLNYLTFKTSSGIKIESPHDFSTINFTSVHTGSVKERYPELVSAIVKKRLVKYGVKDADPHQYFPEDANQLKSIQAIEEEYKKRWEDGVSGSYRPGDDAYRYARPELIRRMSGKSKQGARYKYAGFEQLVHVSSGIIRFFLEPAARMFSEQLQINDGKLVTSISPAVQDQELRKQADQLLLEDFDILETEAASDSKNPGHIKEIQRLRNIVVGIGALFKAHILDETITQRRIFSFSISGEISPDIKSILRLGVSHGYFYLDSIGDKSGMTRKQLYVLTRRLAPAFSLDPIGFSGYLTVTSEFLSDIAERPNAYINRLRKYGLNRDDPSQLSFPEV